MPQTSAWEPQGKDLVDAMLPVGDVRAASNERWRQQVNNVAEKKGAWESSSWRGDRRKMERKRLHAGGVNGVREFGGISGQ